MSRRKPTPADRSRGNTPAAPLHPRELTWASLLGRWVEFAQSALALPGDATGTAMRQCVPDIIMLQAVWCALDDLGGLPGNERALGLDRARLLIQKHEAAIRGRWPSDGLPKALAELIADAHQRLEAAGATRAGDADSGR